jgi:hypothetical protein
MGNSTPGVARDPSWCPPSPGGLLGTRGATSALGIVIATNHHPLLPMDRSMRSEMDRRKVSMGSVALSRKDQYRALRQIPGQTFHCHRCIRSHAVTRRRCASASAVAFLSITLKGRCAVATVTETESHHPLGDCSVRWSHTASLKQDGGIIRVYFWSCAERIVKQFPPWHG